MRNPRSAGAGDAGAEAGKAAASAGALLRAAREAVGLSVEAVAHQLKLAPGQVRALESDDFEKLPGRTFVRGFLRNYARLTGLDANRVLAALPTTADMPTLEAPPLHATAPTMAELPTTESPKARWTRWAIPASLAAVVAVAAIYEWARPAAASRAHPTAKDAIATPPPAQSPPAAEQNEVPVPNPGEPAQTKDPANAS